jgi:NAD(P)-dependent dehydrogenase (short-subunit alcohol dehydrogenase family)
MTAPTPPAQIPRTALVTGAGRGIGRGLALGLVDAGYDVALVGRTPAHLEAVAAEAALARPGVRVATAAVDVTDPAAAREAVLRAEGELGGIGLLVNNAGVIERTEGPFADDDVEDAWRVVETNLRGPFNVTHAALPGMVARGGGRVVNINSGSGVRTGGVYTAYGVSKGALARFTSFLDAQYRAAGVRAFDLAPGVVRTDMTTAMPLHDDRTDWTPIEDVVALLVALGDGRLDRLSGRFVRAGADTVTDLEARTEQILAADARRLALVPWGPDDPLA